jgi:glutamate formiminotransferase/formiminotetrahydrofolate cyclodeaminase
MVANLTVGKKGYEGAWSELDALAVQAQDIKARLMRAVDEDTEAFNDVLAAQKLPKGTEEERRARSAAIQEGYRNASRVPLETARACRDAIRVCGRAAELGNRASVSDAGVGALAAAAGAEGAAMNVLINLGALEDAAFKEDLRSQAEALIAEARELRAKIVELVRGAIGE